MRTKRSIGGNTDRTWESYDLELWQDQLDLEQKTQEITFGVFLYLGLKLMRVSFYEINFSFHSTIFRFHGWDTLERIAGDHKHI